MTFSMTFAAPLLAPSTAPAGGTSPSTSPGSFVVDTLTGQPLLLAAGGAVVALTLLLLAVGVRRRKRRSAGSGTAVVEDAYPEADVEHVATYGVPADAADLARHPVTGDLTARTRRDRATKADPEQAPKARAGSTDGTVGAAAPEPGPADPETELLRHADALADDDGPLYLDYLLAAKLEDPAGAPGPRVPDLPPGTNTVVELPDTFAEQSWSEQILAAHANRDAVALATIAGHHRPLAWSAHLMALSFTTGAAYALHLDAAHAALFDLDTVGDRHEDPRLTAVRLEQTIDVPLPEHAATATVPCTRQGLLLAYAAANLTDPEQVLVLADAHETTGTALALLLAADAARLTGTTGPRTPSRRTDQWGLLFAHTRFLAALQAQTGSSGDLELAAAAVRNRLTLVDSGDLLVDVDALAAEVGHPSAAGPETADRR